jgi:hypothetical protein
MTRKRVHHLVDAGPVRCALKRIATILTVQDLRDESERMWPRWKTKQNALR